VRRLSCTDFASRASTTGSRSEALVVVVVVVVVVVTPIESPAAPNLKDEKSAFLL